MKEQHLLFNYQLSESRIKRLHGNQTYELLKSNKMKSVKSLNPYKSVIQTKYEIIKAYGGQIFTRAASCGESRRKVESKEGYEYAFIIQLPITENIKIV